MPTPIGQLSLQYLVDTFLPKIFPTDTTAQAGQDPTSVAVYNIVRQTDSGDDNRKKKLENLAFSDLVKALAGYTFKVTKYTNGTAAANASVYSVSVQSTDSTLVGRLSIDDIVSLLGQNAVTVTSVGQQPKYYSIVGDLDGVEHNPDLGKPIRPLSPKYVFLLKKLFRFTVTPVDAANQPTGGASTVHAMDGGKNFVE
jgi:hypothetical protein